MNLIEEPLVKVTNEELRGVVEANSSENTWVLVLRFAVYENTVFVHLEQISKVKILDKWVPHDLSENQK